MLTEETLPHLCGAGAAQASVVPPDLFLSFLSPGWTKHETVQLLFLTAPLALNLHTSILLSTLIQSISSKMQFSTQFLIKFPQWLNISFWRKLKFLPVAFRASTMWFPYPSQSHLPLSSSSNVSPIILKLFAVALMGHFASRLHSFPQVVSSA